MKDEGAWTHKPKTPRFALIGLAAALAAVLAAVGLSAGAAWMRAGEAPRGIFASPEIGTFNVGEARAALVRDEAAAPAGALTLRYTLPGRSTAGIWIKAPQQLYSATNVDIVHINATCPTITGENSDHLAELAIVTELKGTRGIQRIPLSLDCDGGSTRTEVDWATIGTLKEVVLAVSRLGDGEPIHGSISFSLALEPLPWFQKLSLSWAARASGVLLVSLLVAMSTAVVQGSGVPTKPTVVARPTRRRRRRLTRTKVWLLGLRRDVILGVAVVAIAALAWTIYLLGQRSHIEVGWTALAVAIAGAGLAEWLKFGLTGRHLTPGEVFQNMLISGLLAASTSSMQILQAPGGWSEALLLSQPVAALTALVYHGSNAFRLAVFKRHLNAVGAVAIAASPYVVGGLLMLASPGLLQTVGLGLSVGLLAAHPTVLQSLGAVAVVFLFNEAVASGLAVVTKRSPVRCLRSHYALLVVAAAVVAAPWVADLGSSAWVAALSPALRGLATILTTILSQAGLWAEAYLITGMLIDALQDRGPSYQSIAGHSLNGTRKGMVFSGVLMGLIQAAGLVWGIGALRGLVQAAPVLAGTLAFALVFPTIKTIVETFDGSRAFFVRVRRSYASPVLYVRGAVVGMGIGLGWALALPGFSTPVRALFGLTVGMAASAGVNLLRDVYLAARGRGSVRSWRAYFVDSLLGGFIGAAVGFYLDASQVHIVADKFRRYLGAGEAAQSYIVYPLLSKWGQIDLGQITGGVRLLLAEALAGVICWSIPAWLFALNRTVMTAVLRRETAPLRALATKQGLAELAQNMIEVMRWGLWMSPIINSFLRPMGEPTWYNQDGAIRTLVAIVQDLTLNPAAFHAWSLGVFVSLLAYDLVRVLIWLDHMGLRVATLVNLSFLGMDRLDQRLARFVGAGATGRYIPEAVKRFTTWAPLLIPFYIPMGSDWNTAWDQAEALRRSAEGTSPLAALGSMSVGHLALAVLGAMIVTTALFSFIRWLRSRPDPESLHMINLTNTEYEVIIRANGESFSHVRERGYDVSRRSYDHLDPAGRTLFVVDTARSASDPARAWPVLGNYPHDRAEPSQIERGDGSLLVTNTSNGVRTTLEITLPGVSCPVELWTLTLENLTDAPRTLKVVPYLEWVLNRPEADRGHTQYNRLFSEMEYVAGLGAVLAWDKHSRAMGLLASDVPPEGYLTSRIDFIGRGRSLWTPRALQTLAFAAAEDTAAHPTFDPIGALLIERTLQPQGTSQVRLLIGLTEDKRQAIDLIARYLQIPGAEDVSPERERKIWHPIGHGEIPAEAPQPYGEFIENGRRLRVHTPLTPRPWDHTMSNALGHVTVVTNRGLHTSASGNSQQNRLTPDWPDIVTREIPSEAIYLYDPDRCRWYSPTYHPLNDPSARHEVDFGVDGTATFRMTQGTLSTELTVFVPPDAPVGVYLLRVRNDANTSRRLRLAPYFQIVLANQPEHAGPLNIRYDEQLHAVFFENPRNEFRKGPAFVAMSKTPQRVETRRGPFFGAGRSVAHPRMVESGHADPGATDDRPVAAMLTTLHLAPHSEYTVALVLGQADDRRQAERVIRSYLDPASARKSLDQTRHWWSGMMDTVRVQSSNPAMDHYLDWLKYQALAERIWARRGFYQTSGAFGFRDQLQDAVNLAWMDPAITRRQILLHASQQFLEGDTVHWFHLLQDGRTGFSARTHASDNLLWLAWAVADYVGMTGDESILDEMTYYLEAEQPMPPLPTGKEGMGFVPLRSAQADSVYRHVMKAIDLVLDRRMGKHGLPLMGAGDWNDGLDEIGAQGRGESVWLALFLYYILDRMGPILEKREYAQRQEHYALRQQRLKEAIESTWHEDRYLRAIHDDGTEIGLRDSGVWEIDALTAAWAAMSGINPERGRIVFDTAIDVLEQEKTILLGSPPLREDTRPYLGRSSRYPEGVRENGMYSHGVQWLVGAARLLAEQCLREGQIDRACQYRETAYRLWLKTSPIPHVLPGEIETYGGQPNKQSADMLTTFDPGRMIWHGYTGAAGWMFRQALEGVLGLRLVRGEIVRQSDTTGARGELNMPRVVRHIPRSAPGPAAPHFQGDGRAKTSAQSNEPTTKPSTPEKRPAIEKK